MYIYALKWKQSGKISPVEAYTDKAHAQRSADYNNKKLRQNYFQKLLGRYWVVQEIYVKEGPCTKQG